MVMKTSKQTCLPYKDNQQQSHEPKNRDQSVLTKNHLLKNNQSKDIDNNASPSPKKPPTTEHKTSTYQEITFQEFCDSIRVSGTGEECSASPVAPVIDLCEEMSPPRAAVQQNALDLLKWQSIPASGTAPVVKTPHSKSAESHSKRKSKVSKQSSPNVITRPATKLPKEPEVPKTISLLSSPEAPSCPLSSKPLCVSKPKRVAKPITETASLNCMFSILPLQHFYTAEEQLRLNQLNTTKVTVCVQPSCSEDNVVLPLEPHDIPWTLRVDDGATRYCFMEVRRVSNEEDKENIITEWRNQFPNFPIRRIWKALESHNGSNSMWSEKYRPVSSDLVLGLATKIEALQDWLKVWRRRTDREARQLARAAKLQRKEKRKKGRPSRSNQPGDSSEDEFHLSDCSSDENGDEGQERGQETPSAILLVGASGIGKTCLAHTVATEAGYKVFEVNAAFPRCRSELTQSLQEAMQSQQVTRDKAPSLTALWAAKNTANDSATATSGPKPRKRQLRLSSSEEDDEGQQSAPSTKPGLKRSRTAVEQASSSTSKPEFSSQTKTPEQTLNSSMRVNPCSLLLFDEVDVPEFNATGSEPSEEATHQMWTTMKHFIRLHKRPILLTAHRITATMSKELGLPPATAVNSREPECQDASLRLKVMALTSCSEPTVGLFLRLVCLAEGFHVSDASEMVKLARAHNLDIRASLMHLQYLLAGSEVSQEGETVQIPWNYLDVTHLPTSFDCLEQAPDLTTACVTAQRLCLVDQFQCGLKDDSVSQELYEETVGLMSRLYHLTQSGAAPPRKDAEMVFSGLSVGLPLRQGLYGSSSEPRVALSLDYAAGLRALCGISAARQNERDNEYSDSAFRTSRRRRMLHYCDQICLDIPRVALDAAARTHLCLSTSTKDSLDT